MNLPNLLLVNTRIVFCIALFLVSGGLQEARAQGSATFRVEENIRAEPRGTILGRVLSGTTLSVLSTEDQWAQVLLEGWIWTRSIQATDRLGFDLVVSATPQENLRDEPSGNVMGRLVEGTLLDRVEDGTGWTRVRRAVWVWAASVELSEGAGGLGGGPTVSRGPETAEERWFQGGPGGAPVLSGPDGDTLGVAMPGTELRVLAREGNWIRVRLEGWSWAPEGEAASPAEGEPVTQPTPGQVVQDPDRYRGRTVTWELQFVSLERAEKIRTDFYEGEPFLLARTGSGDNLFVYIAIPPDRLGEADGLIPLERIRVVGRIRTGAAALTGNPILDLLELSRLAGG